MEKNVLRTSMRDLFLNHDPWDLATRRPRVHSPRNYAAQQRRHFLLGLCAVLTGLVHLTRHKKVLSEKQHKTVPLVKVTHNPNTESSKGASDADVNTFNSLSGEALLPWMHEPIKNWACPTAQRNFGDISKRLWTYVTRWQTFPTTAGFTSHWLITSSYD